LKNASKEGKEEEDVKQSGLIQLREVGRKKSRKRWDLLRPEDKYDSLAGGRDCLTTDEIGKKLESR